MPEISFLQGQPIATDRYTVVEATQLCYYLQCRYFSTWTDNQYQSLKRFNIRYLLSKEDLSALSFLHIKKKLLLENATVFIYEIQ